MREVDLIRRLAEQGLSARTARDKSALAVRAAAGLRKLGVTESADVRIFFAPGRIEVLGKHTDYAGGRSLLMASEQGICFAARSRDDNFLRICTCDLNETSRFRIGPELGPVVGRWDNYPMTVARRLARNFRSVGLKGADIAFTGDLPPAAGMSSSSAMIVGFFMVMSAVNDLRRTREYSGQISTPEHLAEYLGAVENGQGFGSLTGDRGVGTFGGSEDHTAILLSQPNELSQFAFCPVRRERRIPWPAGWSMAVAGSGIESAKTGQAMAKYNQASAIASKIVDLWNASTGQSLGRLAEIIELGPRACEEMRQILRRASGLEYTPAELIARFEQFNEESNIIIPAAGDALACGRIERFGELAGRSQQLAQQLLGNQVSQTIHLACSARRCGAAAASAFGAGFGGAVWALVRDENVRDFLDRWSKDYTETFPELSQKARFFTTLAGGGKFELTRTGEK